jgi:hypothetical protein
MPFYFQEETAFRLQIDALVREKNILLITGAPGYTLTSKASPPGYRLYNRAFLLTPDGRCSAWYDKRHLVPFGEYVPLGDFIPFVRKMVVGAMDFSHESWESRESSHEQSSNNPGFNAGFGRAYERVIYKGLSGFAKGAYNYSRTTSIDGDNSSGEDVIDSEFETNTWDINLGLGYRFSRIHPYVGIGYTQTYQNSDHTEEIQTETETGALYFNTSEFEAEFKQNDFYGFAGVDVQLNPDTLIYVRSTFGDPFQMSVGFKFNLTGSGEK